MIPKATRVAKRPKLLLHYRLRNRRRRTPAAVMRGAFRFDESFSGDVRGELSFRGRLRDAFRRRAPHDVLQSRALSNSPGGLAMFKDFARQAQRSQRWQAASKQEEPLLDRAMRGDPTVCSILAGLVLVGIVVVVYKLGNTR